MDIQASASDPDMESADSFGYDPKTLYYWLLGQVKYITCLSSRPSPLHTTA